MDSVFNAAVEEVCCEGPNGVYLNDLWPKLTSSLASLKITLSPKLKQIVLENLVLIPSLKFEAGDTSVLFDSDPAKCSVEEYENKDVKVVASQAMRNCFLGIAETEASESGLSDVQRSILDRLAFARANGIAQNDLARELRMAPKNFFFPLKTLETQGLIVRVPAVIRKKLPSDRREPNVDGPVHTNMLYLFRYGKHLSSQQRLEICKEELGDTQTETGGDFAEEVGKETVHVKDFLPAIEAICAKLEEAQGKVLVVSEIKIDLGYRGVGGHRAWRAICNRLKDAQVVEECWTEVNNKKVSCLRLLKTFSPSHFEQKIHGRHDEVNAEQSAGMVKRGQITNQVVELPILRQIYEKIDAAGSNGLTNAEVCEWLGLCSREYHKRYFNQRIFRFALHPDLETRRKNQVYRLYTAGNFNPKPSMETPEELESTMKKSPELKSHDENPPQMSVDTSVFTGNVRGTKRNEHSALVEASTGTHVNGEGKSILQLKLNPENSDDDPCDGVPDDELIVANDLVASNDQLESSPRTDATPSRVRTFMRYPCLTTNGANSLREERILKMLQEEKLLIKADLHKRIESLEKEKDTVMDRKTLERTLNKLQREGHCRCMSVGIPSVTNCSRTRTTVVILHPSVEMSTELSGQIHDKIRAFEIQSRQHPPKSKEQSAAILDTVQRVPDSIRLGGQSERAEIMRKNGFVLAKMVRVKLLHSFLWSWISSSPGWDEDLLSDNHACDMKNPHSTCKLFKLDSVFMAMPLQLFLQVVGHAKTIEGMVEKCGSGLLLSGLPVQEYKCLMDTGATARLSGLIDILQRLKLIRLVNKSPTEDGANRPHRTLIHALELKPYIEEPASTAFSSGILSPDLRPQVRHDFVLSSRTAVDEYWNTLEYCYSAARSRAALLAFPGSAVDEVFRPRSWAATRVLSARKRAELLERVATDAPNKKLSFNECRKIARDLDLTLEQVLRIYYDTRLDYCRKSKRNSETGREGIRSVLQQKRKRHRGVSSNHLMATEGRSSAEDPDSLLGSDKQFDDTEQLFYNSDDYGFQLPRQNSTDDRDDQGEPESREEDEAAQASIHKGLSSLIPPRRRKFSWTEEADRKLVIEYARCRAALGAKFNRVDWGSISDLPAYPGACRRRMAILRCDISFRRAVSRLCKKLADRYSKYLQTCPDKILNQVDSVEGKDVHLPDPESEKWDDFDETDIKATLDNVLRLKKMAKIEVLRKNMNQENKDFIDSGGMSQRSKCRKLHPKYVKLLNKGATVSSRMHKSVAIANATELCKLIFLSSSAAPEIPLMLSETLRRYSEHDLFSAFSYLKEKKIMAGGNGKPFALSQQFLQSISPFIFPTDTGKRASMFASWLHEKEKDLVEEGMFVPLDVQCGEIFTLCAQLSLGELAITACLPDKGFGEAEDNSTSKRRRNRAEPDGEIYKRLKTSFVSAGDTTSRRGKGFPGIKLSLHRAKFSKLFSIESSEVESLNPNKISGGNDPTTLPDSTTKCPLVCSDVTDHMKEILDSEGSNHLTVSMNESPWEAMTNYLLSSCSYKVDALNHMPDLFRTIYAAIQKSGDQGLSINEIQERLSIEDEKVLENVVEVLELFGRVLKVNGYDSIHIVDSLYRSKYFLGSVHHDVTHPEGQERKHENENTLVDLDSPIYTDTATEKETNMTLDSSTHRVTILNLPEDVNDHPEGLNKDKMPDSNYSGVAAPEMNWGVHNLMPGSDDTPTFLALFPWVNGDGTMNQPVYNRLVRRILGIVMQNPGILEDGIINQMRCVNPQSCRKLVEIMVLDNHIIPRKMHQMESTQPPSILGGLIGSCSGKPKWISRVHYFANPMSASSL